jgi:hypothetical protein
VKAPLWFKVNAIRRGTTIKKAAGIGALWPPGFKIYRF